MYVSTNDAAEGPAEGVSKEIPSYSDPSGASTTTQLLSSRTSINDAEGPAEGVFKEIPSYSDLSGG